MSDERRQVPRNTCDHAADFDIVTADGQEHQSHQVTVADISGLGARITFGDAGATWDAIAWMESRVGRLKLMVGNRKLLIAAKVVWLKRTPLEAGLFFTEYEKLADNEVFRELAGNAM